MATAGVMWGGTSGPVKRVRDGCAGGGIGRMGRSAVGCGCPMGEAIYLDRECSPARHRLADRAGVIPSDPVEHAQWAQDCHQAAAACAPRWVREAWDRARSRCAETGRAGRDGVTAAVWSWAWLRGYSRAAVCAELATDDGGFGGFDGTRDDECGWIVGELPPAREGMRCPACGCRQPVAPRCERCDVWIQAYKDVVPDAWWDRITAARDGCRRAMLLIESGDTGAQYAHAASCGTRACQSCARVHLARALDRYVAAFAAPLRPSHRFEMFTVGSVAPIRLRSEYSAWRRRVRSLVRAMMDGAPDCGIEPGTWAGGLTVAETTQEPPNGHTRAPDASYAHGHLLVIHRNRYPWGLSMATIEHAWRQAGIPRRKWFTRTGRIRLRAIELVDGWLRKHGRNPRTGKRVACQQCGVTGGCRKGCPSDPRAWLGLRELQRRAGLGEVGHHTDLPQDLTTDDAGMTVVVGYLKKVNAYLKKVSKAGKLARMYTDPACQWMLRGTRRVDPWGCLRGWHAGPTERGAEVIPGQRERRTLVGMYEDEAAIRADGGRPEADDVPRYTWHRLSDVAMEDWRSWADVDAFRKWIDARSRRPAMHPEVPPHVEPWLPPEDREDSYQLWLSEQFDAVRVWIAEGSPTPRERRMGRSERREPRETSKEAKRDYQSSLLPGASGSWSRPVKGRPHADSGMNRTPRAGPGGRFAENRL